MFSIFCFPCQFLSRLLDDFAWRTHNHQKKEEELGATTLSLSALTEPKPAEREDCFSWCCFQFVCLRVWLWVCVCCVLRPFVVDFGCFRGHGCLCVCFCLKRALALSLSVRSHCLCLSRFLPSFSHLLSLSDLHLSLITFTRKYYLLLCFVLLPLICNNSCILRDATVCVCCCVQYRKGRFALFACLPAACVYGFVCCCGVVIFLLAIAQLVLLVCWGCWTFFIIINFLFFFLSAVCGCDSRDVSISNGRGISFYQQQCCSWWQSQFLRRMI